MISVKACIETVDFSLYLRRVFPTDEMFCELVIEKQRQPERSAKVNMVYLTVDPNPYIWITLILLFVFSFFPLTLFLNICGCV